MQLRVGHLDPLTPLTLSLSHSLGLSVRLSRVTSHDSRLTSHEAHNNSTPRSASDQADTAGKTALIRAVQSPSMDEILDEMECDGGSDEDEDSDEDMDEEERKQRFAERLQQRAKRRLEERRQGRASCVQALLEAMALIRGADFPDRAASFKFACERLLVLGEVAATSHVIEHAFVPVEARVVTLTADAQGNVIDFARAVLEP